MITADAAMAALGSVPDPCTQNAGFDISIIDLGLVNGVRIDGLRVAVSLTLTDPGCLYAYRISEGIRRSLVSLGAEEVEIEYEWSSLWDESRLSKHASGQFAAARGRYRDLPTLPVR